MTTETTGTTEAKDAGQYAEVNGINLYYETHGTGRPLVVLHGGLGSSEMFVPSLPALAERHEVIAVDLQGHGRTADIDRPLDLELLAEDTAAFLRYLNIAQADVFGYSNGAAVALRLTVRHPNLVRKQVLASIGYTRDGMYPELWAGLGQMKPEMMYGSPWRRVPQPRARPGPLPDVLCQEDGDGSQREGCAR